MIQVSATGLAPERNWSGTYSYRGRVERPASVEALRELIAGSEKVRLLGSRHSFNAIADSDVVIDTRELPQAVEVDTARRVATVTGNMTYGALALELAGHGMALANYASLPHITIAGAIATGTHGSGVHNRGLAGSVLTLEIIQADGSSVTLGRDDRAFAGSVVSLGAVGAVIKVGLDIEPAYDVRQTVVQDVPWHALLAADLRSVMDSAYSVSLFTRWDDRVDQAWIKQRVADANHQELHAGLADGHPATRNVHPVGDLDTSNCTQQLGVAGPSFDRLPHFRIGFVPSQGNELQSEFILDWSQAERAVEAMLKIGARIRPALLTSEVRAIARDDLWMSQAFGRDSLAIHFTWRPDQAMVESALRLVEARLLPLGARPHWGKLFLAGGDYVSAQYPKYSEFSALTDRVDPGRKFRNAWLERHLFT
jgi:xylitol oxidase